MWSRRTLLQSVLAGSVGSLLPVPARAAGGERSLIVVFAYGGWDTTYLWDPKPSTPGVDQARGDWSRYGALDLWSHPDMPSVHRFFEAWGSRCGVINGVAVNSLVHETCLKKVLSGGSDGQAGLGARVAERLGADKPLPYLLMGGSAQIRGAEALAGQVGYGNQLSTLVAPELAFPSVGGPAAGVPLSSAERDAVRDYLLGAADRLQAERGDVGSNGVRLADFRDAVVRADQIADHSEAGGWLGDRGLFYDYSPWAKAAAALDEGFSQAVFVQDGGYWDTHGGNSGQARLYDDLFGSLDAMMAALRDRGLLETTTVLVVSEMGRSPLLNSLAGKDHWPFTSAMLIGERVQSGVVGVTDDQLAQQPVDLSTGQADAGGRLLQAQDVLATTAELVGLDGRAMYPDAEVIDALVG